jgi:hypothetical protein
MKSEVETKKRTTSNKSRTYLLPVLASKVDIEFEYLIIDTFIKFNPSLSIEYPIGILFEDEATESFEEYKTYLRQSLQYHSEHVVSNHILFIFEFPDEYTDDYIKFKAGKYSRMSQGAKKLILKYTSEVYKYPPLVEDVVGVLWRHKTRKQKLEKSLGMYISDDSELASKIIYENETFNF